MQSRLSRRVFLVRGAVAVSSVALAARLPSSSLTHVAAADTLEYFALDPEWGAGQAGCPADPGAVHQQSGCHACRSCHQHGANKLFATSSAADSNRAHRHCRCRIVSGGQLPRETWVALFGDPGHPERITVDRRWPWVRDVLAGETPVPPAAHSFAHAAFERTWQRHDKPVSDSTIARTWMWGPAPITDGLLEDYLESPNGRRLVQYFDKSRMEITQPDGDSGQIWYVTNGLLATELITGRLQVGDNHFLPREPAQVNVAGDGNDPDGPTYATFINVLNLSVDDEGHVITRAIHRDGSVEFDGRFMDYQVGVSVFADATSHWIATPFWSFMSGTGPIYDGGRVLIAPLFENPYYATGLPITDAYWAQVLVGGVARDVLIQCFERRCLTWTPANPSGWEVEAGNVGQHYYRWRYGALP